MAAALAPFGPMSLLFPIQTFEIGEGEALVECAALDNLLGAAAHLGEICFLFKD